MTLTTSTRCALCRDHAADGLQYTQVGDDVPVCVRCAAPGQELRPLTSRRCEPVQYPTITRTMHADAVRPPRGRR